VKWAWHVVRTSKTRNLCKFLVVKLQEKELHEDEGVDVFDSKVRKCEAELRGLG